VETHEEEEDR